MLPLLSAAAATAAKTPTRCTITPATAVVTRRGRKKRSNPVAKSSSFAANSSYHSSSRSSSGAAILDVLPEVSEALCAGRPVVALESTLLAHGLPHPNNVDLARDLSSIIRSRGAVPATVAVRNGRCKVGLTAEELDDLAASGMEKRAAKCSTRDLPFVLAEQRMDAAAAAAAASSLADSSKSSSKSGSGQWWGATTVASTMRIAHMAGIRTFVTGGTGGVHRGGESSMDISADLLELARTPVLVVSAGVKSILDIHRTLEALETNGVPVAAFRTDEFPAFFSPASGIAAPSRVDSAEEAAESFLASLELGLDNGMLIAVPNDDPAGAAVEAAILETLEEANESGVAGRDVTPFVLKEVAEKTKGDSLKSNVALVKRNAAVGADIAVAIANSNANITAYPAVRPANAPASLLTKFQKKEEEEESFNDCESSRVIVMGGSVVDLVAKPEVGNELLAATSNPGSCRESDGGVGRNIAEVLGRLGSKPLLYTAVGHDSRGKALVRRMQQEYDIHPSRQRIEVVPNSNTPTYLAVLDSSGDLHTAIADMKILEKIPVPDQKTLSKADFLVVDANAPIESLVKAAENALLARTKVCFEPTSVPKAAEASQNDRFVSAISFAFPNVEELFAMAARRATNLNDPGASESNVDAAIQDAARDVLDRFHPVESHLIITMGAKGVTLASKYGTKPIVFKHFKAKSTLVNNCTGAGDTLAGAFVSALLEGYSIEGAIELGMEKARLSLRCEYSAISLDL